MLEISNIVSAKTDMFVFVEKILESLNLSIRKNGLFTTKNTFWKTSREFWDTNESSNLGQTTHTFR